MPKQISRFDPALTGQLAHLREEAGMTQHEAARYFGLRDRGSVHAWESGNSSPPAKHRARFFGYLLDKLGLRRSPVAFFALWNSVMVQLWEWDPPGDGELAAYFPHGLPAGTAHKAIFLAPPKPSVELIGRSELRHSLHKLLSGLHDTALYGLPGVGKTSLAIDIANDRELLRQFRDGVLWARLGRGADVLSELGKWASALGMAAQELAGLTTIIERAEAVHQRLGMQRLLLIMDDVWELEEGLAFQVGGPNCVRLYTTRFPAIAAHLAGDGALRVSELDASAGLQLLRRLAPAVVQREPEAAGGLVRHVGGLPLALVLSAHYLRSQSQAAGSKPAEIGQLLKGLQAAGERLGVAEPQAPLRRHPSLPAEAPISLQAVIALSYQALSEELQTALRAFALFPPKPNSFPRDAALSTAGVSGGDMIHQAKGAADAIDQVLLGTSLVEAPEPERLTLHQTVADYIRLQPPLHAAVERMALFFIGRLREYPEDYAFVEQEQANIIAALELAAQQSLNTLVIDGVEEFYRFAENRGAYAMVDPLLELACARAQAAGDQAAVVKFLFKRSLIALQRGEHTAAEALVEQAAELSRALDNPTFAATQLVQLGQLAVRRSQYAKAKSHYLAALALTEGSGDISATVGVLTSLGRISYEQGFYNDAKPFFMQAYTLAIAHGFREHACGALVNLTGLCIDEGAYDEADEFLPQAVALARATEHRYLLSIALQNQGYLAYKRLDYTSAEASLAEALQLGRELAVPRITCGSLRLMADVATAQHKFVGAERFLTEAMHILQGLDEMREHCGTHLTWGRLRLAQGDPEAASSFSTALRIAQEFGLRPEDGEALYGLAQFALLNGDAAAAREHGAQALRILQAARNILSVEVQQWLAALDAQH